MPEQWVCRIPVVVLEDERVGIVTKEDAVKILVHDLTFLLDSTEKGLKFERKRRQ
jgi:hypothetical protein